MMRACKHIQAVFAVRGNFPKLNTDPFYFYSYYDYKQSAISDLPEAVL